jgi:hypothetical protein
MNIEKRIELEKRIARKVVRALLAAGYELSIDNGGETREIPYTTDFKTVTGAMFATDDEHLLARGPSKSFVYFVYGNDGWDVINDYGLSLEPIMEPIEEYCRKLG